MKLTQIFSEENKQKLLSSLDLIAPAISYDIKHHLEVNEKQSLIAIINLLIGSMEINPEVAKLFDYTEEELTEMLLFYNADKYGFIKNIISKIEINAMEVVPSLDEKFGEFISYVTANTLFVAEDVHDFGVTFLAPNKLCGEDLIVYVETLAYSYLSAYTEVKVSHTHNIVNDFCMITISLEKVEPEIVESFLGQKLMGAKVSVQSETNEIFSGVVTYVANKIILGKLEFGSEIGTKNVSVNIMDSDGIPRRGIVVELIALTK